MLRWRSQGSLLHSLGSFVPNLESSRERRGETESRERLMSPQTETKASVGFQAGVKDSKLTYYTYDYETKDTDILASNSSTLRPPLRSRSESSCSPTKGELERGA